MTESTLNRRSLLASVAAVAAAPSVRGGQLPDSANTAQIKETGMKPVAFTRTQTLLAFWKEIDDKTWGRGFDCFAENATANLGVSDWHGREAIRENLRAFVDKGFTAHHDVVEYWDGGQIKVFRGFVTMTPNDPTQKPVRPAMTHFFYMDHKDSSKVIHWHGSVGPVAF
jgi:hypothetical protein